MREIKFRAWDGKGLRYDVTGFEHGRENEMAGVFLDGDYYAIVDNVNECDSNNPCAVVMQSTGLKDKNGKEIYEGDIINQDFKYGWKNHVMELMHSTASDDMGLDMYGYPDVDGACEVIGNIYENHELLEKE
jgi:hypothetical protein